MMFQPIQGNFGQHLLVAQLGRVEHSFFKYYVEKIYLVDGHMPGAIPLFSGHKPADGFQTILNPLSFAKFVCLHWLNIEYRIYMLSRYLSVGSNVGPCFVDWWEFQSFNVLALGTRVSHR